MSTFVMLTKVSHQGMHCPHDLEALEKNMMDHIHSECPEVKWQQSFAIPGPYDYLDIFEAQDVEDATKVSTLVRTIGHADVQLWPATEWGKFKEMLHTLPRA